jgi:two-component system, chemotaxis family, CheB/CheR fusion protein
MSSSTHSTTIIVGIGASAGGLEALQELVKNLPQDNEALSYIIAQHLSPGHKSEMVKLMGKVSPLEVIEAQDGMLVEPKKIYITPPNKHILISDDTIILKALTEDYVGPKPSIDMFFASLAESKRHDAVAIILSGTGTDGTKGCAKIKAEGGITIAQDPKDAKYDGMPVSAIQAGQIDIVLTCEKIGAELAEIEKYISGEIGLNGHSSTHPRDSLERIFAILRDANGTDFSNYKLTTLNRRIKRRMVALKISKIDDYVSLLQTDANELATLHKDFLIGVTAFFRDKEAFDDLRTELSRLLLQKGAGEGLKIWDVACCTGEETYSIAIIIAELMEEQKIHRDVHIFATDIDTQAIKIARAGVYSAADISDVPSELVKKYFTLKNDSYKINKNIRDMIIFSSHNVVRDPPFTKLDAIVCRNLLIYFNASLQASILPMFHYAIKSNGLLFLGMSESVGPQHNLFTPLTKNSKIYRREFSVGNIPPKTLRPYHYSSNIKERAPIDMPAQKKSLNGSLIETLGDYFLPLSVLVNEGMDIVFIKERNPYILYSGTVTTNIFKSVHESLSLELHTLIRECLKDDKPQIGMFRKVELFKDVVRLVRVIVMPLMGHNEEGKLFIVSFQEESVESLSGAIDIEGASSDNKEVLGLQAELGRTKVHLQAVIDELDNSNEELQSLNEEMQSANEELKSTNEELETTNEELQGTNEELQTAYAELRAVADEIEGKNKKVEALNDELTITTEKALLNEALAKKERQFAEELIEASNALIVVLDKKGKIIAFNKQLEDITGYSKVEAIGQDWFSMFVPQAQSKEIFKAFKQMLLAKEKAIMKYESPILLKDGSERVIAWQDSIHINPSGNANVLAFGIDITERNLVEKHLKLQDAYLNLIANSQNTISIISDGHDILDANRAFFLFFDEFDTVEAFNKSKCICDYFEKVDKPRFVYDGKDGRDWLDIVADKEIHQALIIKNGEEHYFILRLAEFGNISDKRKIISMTDITEIENYRLGLEEKMANEIKHSKMQEQLMIQQGKMAAMGEMLGAIAHQWRQPLNTLGIIVQDVGQAYIFKLIDKEYVERFKGNSMRLIQYMSKTIDDFKDFFKPNTEDELFFASDSLGDSFEIFGALLEHNQISIEQTIAHEHCDRLFCNKNQLKQVFLNIISNAKDAMLESMEKQIIETGLIQTKILCEDSYVLISIWNNGPAIPKGVVSRLFEPYFTTKDCGKGTGIGLYMSKVIVEQNLKGKIGIQNKDNGVEVTIEIPFAPINQ